MNAPVHAVLAVFGAQPFFIIAGLAAVVLVAAVFFGAWRWQQPGGKAIAIAAGFILVLLAVFVLGVLFLADSARKGAPM